MRYEVLVYEPRYIKFNAKSRESLFGRLKQRAKKTGAKVERVIRVEGKERYCEQIFNKDWL